MELQEVLQEKLKYDEKYWANRNFENKHSIMTFQWINFFEPKKCLDVGCGCGYAVHSMRYYGVDCDGIDISEYAVKNAYQLAAGHIEVGSCTELPIETINHYDLILCNDVLEHLSEEDIKKTIINLKAASTKNILVSICFQDDHNFALDNTHVTARSREWWIDKFADNRWEQLELPKYFLFREQLLAFRKKN